MADPRWECIGARGGCQPSAPRCKACSTGRDRESLCSRCGCLLLIHVLLGEEVAPGVRRLQAVIALYYSSVLLLAPVRCAVPCWILTAVLGMYGACV